MMKKCRWVKPVLVGQFEFTEWMPDGHLRHSRFVALRDDKKPRSGRAGELTQNTVLCAVVNAVIVLISVEPEVSL